MDSINRKPSSSTSSSSSSSSSASAAASSASASLLSPQSSLSSPSSVPASSSACQLRFQTATLDIYARLIAHPTVSWPVLVDGKKRWMNEGGPSHDLFSGSLDSSNGSSRADNSSGRSSNNGNSSSGSGNSNDVYSKSKPNGLGMHKTGLKQQQKQLLQQQQQQQQQSPQSLIYKVHRKALYRVTHLLKGLLQVGDENVVKIDVGRSDGLVLVDGLKPGRTEIKVISNNNNNNKVLATTEIRVSTDRVTSDRLEGHLTSDISVKVKQQMDFREVLILVVDKIPDMSSNRRESTLDVWVTQDDDTALPIKLIDSSEYSLNIDSLDESVVRVEADPNRISSLPKVVARSSGSGDLISLALASSRYCAVQKTRPLVTGHAQVKVVSMETDVALLTQNDGEHLFDYPRREIIELDEEVVVKVQDWVWIDKKTLERNAVDTKCTKALMSPDEFSRASKANSSSSSSSSNVGCRLSCATDFSSETSCASAFNGGGSKNGVYRGSECSVRIGGPITVDGCGQKLSSSSQSVIRNPSEGRTRSQEFVGGSSEQLVNLIDSVVVDNVGVVAGSSGSGGCGGGGSFVMDNMSSGVLVNDDGVAAANASNKNGISGECGVDTNDYEVAATESDHLVKQCAIDSDVEMTESVRCKPTYPTVTHCKVTMMLEGECRWDNGVGSHDSNNNFNVDNASSDANNNNTAFPNQQQHQQQHQQQQQHHQQHRREMINERGRVSNKGSRSHKKSRHNKTISNNNNNNIIQNDIPKKNLINRQKDFVFEKDDDDVSNENNNNKNNNSNNENDRVVVKKSRGDGNMSQDADADAPAAFFTTKGPPRPATTPTTSKEPSTAEFANDNIRNGGCCSDYSSCSSSNCSDNKERKIFIR
ncbi:hypothetical protein HELRODRAFT_180617 [Helobdella robusta]|uniref:Uncharacterized protein n=1 Tax=Helobdella robusta TaxID=6412 RepID=T1FG35_HELRO|nr:hypothetical protein HELRODRAFT_180617 [Helobdella robusta]ESN93750.1 hypothetical protein HELRODRAFT_180617 [Helobdella robusta]